MNVNRWKDKELKEMEKVLFKFLVEKNIQVSNLKIHSSFLVKEKLMNGVRNIGAFVIEFKNDANYSLNLTTFAVVPEDDKSGYKVGVAVPGFMQ